MNSEPRRSGSGEPERIYERDPDPAEAADRPLEPKWTSHELADRDEPQAGDTDRDPHGGLNTSVGEVDPAADSDPYERPTPDDDADRASGTRGSGQGSEDR